MHWGRHHHLQAHFGSPLQGAEHNFMWISIRGGQVVYFHMRICGIFVVVFVIVFVFVFAFSSDFWIAIVISFQNMYGIGVCEASEQCYWSSLKWWRKDIVSYSNSTFGLGSSVSVGWVKITITLRQKSEGLSWLSVWWNVAVIIEKILKRHIKTFI